MKLKKDRFEKILKTFTITFFSLSTLFLIYAVLFANKALPNTYFANLNVAGKNQNQISNVVDARIDSFKDRKLSILVGGKIINHSPQELGITYDSNTTKQKILDITFTENPLEGYKNRLRALFIITRIAPNYSIDHSKLNNILDKHLDELEKAPINATIGFVDGEPQIRNEQRGIVVDRSKLLSDLVGRLDNFSPEPITAVYIEDRPKIRSEKAQAAFEKVSSLNNQRIILSHKFDTWSLSGETLSGLLEFYPGGMVNGQYLSLRVNSIPLVILDINFKDKEEPVLQVQLNEEKVSNFIDDMAIVINKPTVDANLEFDGVKVSKFTPAQDGQALDRELTHSLILNAVSIDNINAESKVAIKLPVDVTRAKIVNEEINSLGIKEVIASGVSYFAGSIANRAFNIGLGSQLINGTVVAPGETFSFNKLVGPVSAQQGFKEAYVISKGRTVLDDGGGICQVSTTVFRAALNAGLPVEARTAHAYRVSYYEQKGFAPGFDATIWSPTVDLKFRNDTNHHILVQATVNTTQSKLQIDIYGTSDGRRVELSDPVLSNRKPAPEPLYQDDPTLAKGVVKQVDWAAEGLTSVFTRKVFRGDELLIDEAFKSNFRPWQAVYLVGTGG